MTTDDRRSWLDDAVSDLEALEASSGPAIARRLRGAIALLAGMNGGTDLRDALLRPGTTPFAPLVDAAAHDLGLDDDPRVGLVGRATLLLYLYVRMQDDLVDEPSRVDRLHVYAMELALSRHLELLAEAGLAPAALRKRSEIMARFSQVAAEEADRREVGEALSFERVGDKFLPMAAPLMALASFAGREELWAPLVAWVGHVGTALQVINDVLNVAEDHALHRPTALLHALAPQTRAVRGHALRAAALADPATRAALQRARDAAERARTLAVDLRLPGLSRVAEGIGASVARTDARLLGIMLGVEDTTRGSEPC